MLNFLSKCFEKVCVIAAILVLIAFAASGALAGYSIASGSFYPDEAAFILIVIAGVVIGLLLGFMTDTLTFGLYAQIIQIRKGIDRLNRKEDQKMHREDPSTKQEIHKEKV